MSGRSVPVTELKGIGPKSAAALKKLNILTTEDLLRHYPTRFVRYPEITPADKLTEGCVAAIKASPDSPLTVIRRGAMVMTQGRFSDGSGTIPAVWYHMPYLKNTVKTSGEYVLFGRAVKKRGRFYMEQPYVFRPAEYEKLSGRLKPVYPLTEGISNRLLVKAVEQALAITPPLEDTLPERIRSEYGLMPLDEAVRSVHMPESSDSFDRARERVVFDEFFSFLTRVRFLKEMNDRRDSPYPMRTEGIAAELEKALPFTLTEGQRKAAGDILRDLSSGHIMNRLIEGDVGSGKTAVSLFGLLAACRNGMQSAVMVPTEVLARQHYRTLTSLFAALDDPPSVTLLTGSMTNKEKTEARRRIAAHETDVIIGTHALIQESVAFDRLALVVTDEQHRFGVRQRELLADKGGQPHMLVMSATPIPRTLAVILYGDLDLSVIEKKPVGRLPVLNCVIGKEDRRKAWIHILRETEKGRQAYIICPLVEESELLDEENVTDYAKRVSEAFGPRARVGILHGKMPDKKKNEVMEAFLNKEYDILVSTTVVEVGVDVPNATVMMIENAERFGLAQLHQLRGRVGRGEAQSYCIFVRTSDSGQAAKRLDIVNHSNDGFEIAAQDLKLRGPGELFGSEQSGELTFGMADIYNDSLMLEKASKAVKMLTSAELGQYGSAERPVLL